MSEKQESWVARIADNLSNNVQPVDNLTGSLEAIILALVGPVSTWMIAAPNVWLVAQFNEKTFGFNLVLSVIVAIAFEGIGQGLANDWVRGRQWNAIQTDSDKCVNEKGLFRRMWAYFVIDLAMVGTLAFQNFGEGKGAEVFLTLLFPVVVIITTLAANERSTLYRLRRERDRLQEEQKPFTGQDVKFTELRQEFTELAQSLETVKTDVQNRQMIIARYADFKAAIAKLNGNGDEFIKTAKVADVVEMLAKRGRSTSPNSAGKFLREARK